MYITLIDVRKNLDKLCIKKLIVEKIKMSFPEKQDIISKDEWIAKLEEGSHIQRVSMNNLIMNYLVTGR